MTRSKQPARKAGRRRSNATKGSDGVEGREIMGVQGNELTQVELSVGVAARSIVVGRQSGKVWAFDGDGSGISLWLPEDDYLLVPSSPSHNERRPSATHSSRFFVHEGTAVIYGLPEMMPNEPEEVPTTLEAAPRLERLYYGGRLADEARLVTRWSTGGEVVCVELRHEDWHGEALTVRCAGPAVALCLPDGAYEVRAATLDAGARRKSFWSDGLAFSIAERRYCVSEKENSGALIDLLNVKSTWSTDGALDDATVIRVRQGVSVVRLRWTFGRGAIAKFLACWLPEAQHQWRAVIASDNVCELELPPGRHRVRIAAFDAVSFQRSRFFAEAVIEISGRTVRVRTPEGREGQDNWSRRAFDGQAFEADILRAASEFMSRPLTPLREIAHPASTITPVGSVASAGDETSIRQLSLIGDLLASPRQVTRLAAVGEALARAGSLAEARKAFQRLRRHSRELPIGPARIGQIAELEGQVQMAADMYSAAGRFPAVPIWKYNALRLCPAGDSAAAEWVPTYLLALMSSEGWVSSAVVALAALQKETLGGGILGSFFRACGLAPFTFEELRGGRPSEGKAASRVRRTVVGHPLVSVVVPLNSGRDRDLQDEISASIAAIDRQMRVRTELIVCTDNDVWARQIVDRLVAEREKLKVCVIAGQCDMSAYVAAGLKVAEGEFVTVLDSRVISHPERLERQLDCMGQMSVASTSHSIVVAEGGNLVLRPGGAVGVLPESLLFSRAAAQNVPVVSEGGWRVGDYCSALIRSFAPGGVASSEMPLCVEKASKDERLHFDDWKVLNGGEDLCVAVGGAT